jgi:hypothetical protein
MSDLPAICGRSGRKWNGCSKLGKRVVSPRPKACIGRSSSCVRRCERSYLLQEWNRQITRLSETIRPGVPGRKGSFRTHSADGCQFVEALTIVVAMLKQQHRNVLDYLTAAYEAA